MNLLHLPSLLNGKLLLVLAITGITTFGCKKNTVQLVNDVGREFIFEGDTIAPGIVHGRVYESGRFNAFTDLVYYKGKWMIIFREGSDHVGGANGRLKLVSSSDGNKWTVERIYSLGSEDLRDPKFFVDSVNKELFITFFGLSYPGGRKTIRNFIVRYTNDTFTGGKMNLIESDTAKDINFVFWRFTQWNGKDYCLAYRENQSGDPFPNLYLFQKEQLRCRTLKSFHLSGMPSECTIRFHNERMYVIVRAEYKPAYIGCAAAPFEEFAWLNNNGMPRLASPNFLFYKSFLLISGRDLDDRQFKFFTYDLSTGKVSNKFTFPGGVEVGYAGMTYNPANGYELWMSYYSINESGSGVFLVKMDLTRLQ